MLAKTAFFLGGLLACATACQAAQQDAVPPGQTEAVLDSGQATWYGPRHAGLRTFSGERFNPRLMTAAHPSLAMGTLVRVTDLSSGRSVIVRVNDREPPHGVRCIDLSEGAAVALGMHGRGVADVTITAVSPKAEDGVVEVAEAPDEGVGADRPIGRHINARHGRLHRRHAGR